MLGMSQTMTLAEEDYGKRWRGGDRERRERKRERDDGEEASLTKYP